MKKRAKELGLDDVRINNAGCLERCELGPTMVIYPQGIWYHYSSTDDIDEILESHILKDRPVNRLLLRDRQKYPEYSPPARLNLVVSALTRHGGDLLLIEFKDSAGGDLPKFTAGAHLDLLLDNDRMRRSYALINHPDERDRYLIAVQKGENEWGAAQWMFSELRIGRLIQARHPDNFFALDESADRSILAGAGIGVAPFLPMVHQLRETGTDFHVHCTVEPNGGAVLLDELRRVCGTHLTIHDDRSDRTSSTSLGRMLQSPSERSHLYLSGLGPFVSQVLRQTSDWSPEVVHTQYWSAPALRPSSGHRFGVSLARQQKTLQVNEDVSVLDVLRNAGIPIDYACNNGLCGACRIRVLHGKVEHRDWVLSEAEKSRQDSMMACVSRAAIGEPRLIVDL